MFERLTPEEEYGNRNLQELLNTEPLQDSCGNRSNDDRAVGLVL